MSDTLDHIDDTGPVQTGNDPLEGELSLPEADYIDPDQGSTSSFWSDLVSFATPIVTPIIQRAWGGASGGDQNAGPAPVAADPTIGDPRGETAADQNTVLNVKTGGGTGSGGQAPQGGLPSTTKGITNFLGDSTIPLIAAALGLAVVIFKK